jgi:hypothetical protein
MIKNIEELIRVCNDKWNELKNISPEYLNDAGKAALDAYKTIQWHLMFHGSMESLKDDEEFMNIINIPGKHPEFYKVIRRVYRAIEKSVEE